ncbi:DUF3857 domain-containing protein [Sphingomonas sp.]|uniref:DUF3857 domain-containing protein n=1 Tax=Sphingomonas sp. TaxID=28214 RepID=UPI002ED93C89
MRNLLVLGALILASAALAEDKPKVAPVPAWVSEYPRAGKGSAPAPSLVDAPLEILRLDHQFRFGAQTDERYVESAVKLLNPQGLAAMGTIVLPWRPESGTLTIHKLNIVRGAETIDVLAKQSFTVLRREGKLEESVLDGLLTATLQPEGLQVGDVIELAFTITHRDPVLGAHSELAVDLPAGLPGTRTRLRASWPGDRPLQWRKSGELGEPRKWASGSEQHVEWTLEGLPALKVPKGAPLRFMPVRRVEFTQFSKWGDLAAILAPHYEKAATLGANSPLKAEIARIRAMSTDPKVQAAAALKLVQDRVRYVYRGMNEGNLAPAGADETWARRFGDCKGKTALLLALLHGLGIEADAASVSTAGGDGLDARLPMAGLFDHVLVRAQIGGRTYWLDGTRTGDGAIDAIDAPPFRWALPLRAQGAELVAIPQQPLARPASETDIFIDAKAGISLPAPIEVTTVTRGDEAQTLRLQLAPLSAEQLDTALKAYWKRRYDFVTPEKVSASFNEQTGEHRLVLAGKAALSWDAGGGYELDGARLGWEMDTEREAGTDAEAPYAVSFPHYAVTRERIDLPRAGQGFSIKGADVPLRKLAGYEFARRTRIEDGVLEMESSTRALLPEISAAEARAAAAPMKAMADVTVMVMAPHDYRATSAETAALEKEIPTTADGWNRRGNSLMEDNRLDDAIADFDKAIKLDADHATAWANRGIALAWKKQNEQALDSLDKAAAINPRLAYIFHGRAIVLQNQGDLGGAAAALGRAIDLLENNLWAHGRRAAILMLQREYARALADADAILKVQPGQSFAQNLRWRAQAGSGDLKGALATVDAAIARSDDPEVWWPDRAGLLIKLGRGDEARALLAKMRAKSPRGAFVLNQLCWVQAGAKFDLDQAHADCTTALKVMPGSAPIIDSLALVLLRQGKFDESIARYSAALAKAPKQAASLYGRGIAKLSKGDKAGGDADVKAAIAEDPFVVAQFQEMGIAP